MAKIPNAGLRCRQAKKKKKKGGKKKSLSTSMREILIIKVFDSGWLARSLAAAADHQVVFLGFSDVSAAISGPSQIAVRLPRDVAPESSQSLVESPEWRQANLKPDHVGSATPET